MPDENVFDLPQPADREALFQILVLQRLDQIGEALANLFEAERADNGEKWANTGRKREHSVIDFTASPDKSVMLRPLRHVWLLFWIIASVWLCRLHRPQDRARI